MKYQPPGVSPVVREVWMMCTREGNGIPLKSSVLTQSPRLSKKCAENVLEDEGWTGKAQARQGPKHRPP